MIWETIIKVLLYRYSGQEDLVIGTAVAGRQQLELEDQLGFFVNTICLRSSVNGSHGFEDQLRTERQAIMEAFEHQAYPFDLVVEAIGEQALEAGRHPIFDVMLVMQNNMDTSQPNNQWYQPVHIQNQYSKFDLLFNIVQHHNNDIQLDIEYNAALYNNNLINSIAKALQTIIADLKTKGTKIPVNQLMNEDQSEPTTADESLLIETTFNF